MQLEDNVTVISFSCEATGSPKPVIGWLKNNSTKVGGTVIQTGSISSLILVLLRKEKFPGKYNCFAENSVGKVYSNEATLAFPTKRPHPRAKGIVYVYYFLSNVSSVPLKRYIMYN